MDHGVSSAWQLSKKSLNTRAPSIYYVSTILELFGPNHPLCKHKYSTERQQKKYPFSEHTHPVFLLMIQGDGNFGCGVV